MFIFFLRLIIGSAWAEDVHIMFKYTHDSNIIKIYVDNVPRNSRQIVFIDVVRQSNVSVLFHSPIMIMIPLSRISAARAPLCAGLNRVNRTWLLWSFTGTEKLYDDKCVHVVNNRFGHTCTIVSYAFVFVNNSHK